MPASQLGRQFHDAHLRQHDQHAATHREDGAKVDVEVTKLDALAGSWLVPMRPLKEAEW